MSKFDSIECFSVAVIPQARPPVNGRVRELVQNVVQKSRLPGVPCSWQHARGTVSKTSGRCPLQQTCTLGYFLFSLHIHDCQTTSLVVVLVIKSTSSSNNSRSHTAIMMRLGKMGKGGGNNKKSKVRRIVSCVAVDLDGCYCRRPSKQRTKQRWTTTLEFVLSVISVLLPVPIR